MAESVVINYFPSQTVSDTEKITEEYGLKNHLVLTDIYKIKIIFIN